MNKTFVIADLHLMHPNILTYSPERLDAILEEFPHYNRKFLEDNIPIALQLMEELFVKNWNSVVPKDGHVYILGDLTLKKDKELITNFLNRLNGYKHLVRGNHDILPGPVYVECGFRTVSNHPVMWNGLVLSHEPIEPQYINQHLFNYFGHVHGRTDWNWSRGQCVSCEQTNFKPYEITKEIAKGAPKNEIKI